MSLFVCYKCNVVDTVELVYSVFPSHLNEQLCSKCFSGKWHDKFERKEYNQKQDIVVNRPNNFSF